MLSDHLHPGGGVDLHQRVGNEDDMHPIEDRCDDRVPEPRVPLEVQHTDHNLALGVAASEGQRARHGEHGSARHRHAEHGAVLLCCVLHIGWSVVGEPRRGAPLLGRPGQMFRDEPLQTGPALEL